MTSPDGPHHREPQDEQNSDNSPGPQANEDTEDAQDPRQAASAEPPAPPQAVSQASQRVPSGVGGLDTILRGGFLRGGIYIILGQPGTGKTILSNQIAFNHVSSGHRAVFVSILSETHDHMFAHLSSLSFFNWEPIGNNRLYYISGHGVAQKEGLKGLLPL